MTANNKADITDIAIYEYNRDTSDDQGNFLTKIFPAGIMNAPTVCVPSIMALTIMILRFLGA